MAKNKSLTKNKRYFDYSLLFIVLFLLGFGLIMIYSTSSYVSSLANDGNGFFYLKAQARSAIVGLVAMFIVSFIPYKLYENFAVLIYFGSVLLILMVLTPLGQTINGARRWFFIFGYSIQPAEIVKLGIILFLAALISRLNVKDRRSWKGIFIILMPAAVVSGMLYFITNNLSSAIIVAGIAFFMLVISTPGCVKAYVMFALAITGVVAYVLAVINGWLGSLGFRGERILAWTDPEAHADGKGFQVLQSLYGIGSGGIWGKGLGKSMQKLGFLPEAQNDMIFSIICEELGIFGGIAVILLFVLLLWRIRDAGVYCTEMYGNLVIVGIFVHIAIQVIINIAVVTNTIPNTGIPMPFISYGGSSVIFILIEMGIVMNIARSADFRETPALREEEPNEAENEESES
ncbi:MAG: putative lipid II flippase FtsW [Lachnospiraceae bacterium]|nr:putative lipid II flippase FtsW [Lachnospiraceae bacterium]